MVTEGSADRGDLRSPWRRALGRRWTSRFLAGALVIGALGLAGWIGSSRAEDAALALVPDGAPHAVELVLNGQRFTVVSGRTRRDLADVLGSFADRCRPSGASPLAWRTALDRAGPSPAPLAEADGYPRSRVEDGDHGQVTCLFLPGATTAAAIGRRVDELARTGRLTEGAAAQHLYARRIAGGTSFALIWNPATLDLSALRAGSDPRGVEAPGAPTGWKARTVFRSHAGASAPRMTMYESGDRPDDLRTAFASRLAPDGWRVATIGDGLVARRGARIAWITFGARGDATWTTVIEDDGTLGDSAVAAPGRDASTRASVQAGSEQILEQ